MLSTRVICKISSHVIKGVVLNGVRTDLRLWPYIIGVVTGVLTYTSMRVLISDLQTLDFQSLQTSVCTPAIGF